MARIAGALIALAVLTACGDDAAVPDPQPRAHRPAPEPAPRCELGPIALLMPSARARGGLTIHGGWVAALDDVLSVRDPETPVSAP